MAAAGSQVSDAQPTMAISTDTVVSWQLQPATNPTSRTTPITIAGVKYDIDVTQIPYLSSFVDFQSKTETEGIDLVRGPIPQFDAALKGIQSRYHQCFRALPPDLTQHHALCETLDFLGVDVLGG